MNPPQNKKLRPGLNLHRLNGLLIYLVIFGLGLGFTFMNMDFSDGAASAQYQQFRGRVLVCPQNGHVFFVGGLEEEKSRIRWVGAVEKGPSGSRRISVYAREGREKSGFLWFYDYALCSNAAMKFAEAGRLQLVAAKPPLIVDDWRSSPVLHWLGRLGWVNSDDVNRRFLQ